MLRKLAKKARTEPAPNFAGIGEVTAHLHYENDPMRKAGRYLWWLWQHNIHTGVVTRSALQAYFEQAIRHNLLDATSLAQLCLQLMEEAPCAPGAFRTPAVESFL